MAIRALGSESPFEHFVEAQTVENGKAEFSIEGALLNRASEEKIFIKIKVISVLIYDVDFYFTHDVPPSNNQCTLVSARSFLPSLILFLHETYEKETFQKPYLHMRYIGVYE